MTSKKVLSYQLSLIYLIGYVVCVFVEIKFIKFKYIGTEELKCSTDDIVSNDNIGKSVSQLASKCFDMSSCFGLIHLPLNNKYVGCKTQFADNASYITLEGASYVRLRQTYKGENFWLGGIRKESTIFVWLDGTELSHSSYTNWNVGEPNSLNSDEHCLMKYGNHKSWKWNDVTCAEEYFSLCELL